MNIKTAGLSIVICFVLFSAPLLFAQEASEKLTLRTMTVDWYQYAGPGVKLQYRSYDNRPVILYLPLSFEKKFYRFVEAPKYASDNHALPVLLVHMRGSDVIFIDIYTRYMMKEGRIADYNQTDLDNFRAAEEKGRIELIFN
jgi:hypothetical protein